MAIFRRNKWILILLLLVSTSGCATDKCPDNVVNEFVIDKWQGEHPKTISLNRYRKNSGFKKPEEIFTTEKFFIIEYPTEASTSRAINIHLGSDKRNLVFLPINADYKLILDNKIEYRITDIESTNEGRWGCPLKSLKVNNKVYASLQFEQSEGEPVKQ